MASVAPIDPATAAADGAAELNALAAAGTFGAFLRTTPGYVALLAAGAAMDADPVAAAAIEAHQGREAALRVEAAMNMLSDDQAKGLAALLDAVYAVPSVDGYVASLAAFGDVCRETAAVVSAAIGIDFAANSRASGCCGG
jgi:hypothetical protein